MDRRSALKKLGVGGAVAISAPVLLDTFNVAHAATFIFPDYTTLAAGVNIDPGNKAVTVSINPSDFPGCTFEWALQNPPGQTSITNGALTSSVTVDKQAGSGNPATPSFTLRLTVTLDGNVPESQIYTVSYIEGSGAASFTG